MTEKIFISYSRKDSAIVLPFKDELERRLGPGTCWIDKRIRNGRRFDDEIINAILRTDIFVLVLSADSQKSEWTRKEMDFASSKDKILKVIQIDDAPLKNWYIFNYGRLHRTRINDFQAKSALMDELKSCVSSGPVAMPSSAPIEDETITLKGISFKMIAVQGGTFHMGSVSGHDDEKPLHKVTLSPYHIGETEVTQQLWETVMGSNPSSHISPHNPVECVSWTDCQEFIFKLNSMTGKKFRLPTESEWEYAARGGHNSKGHTYSGSSSIAATAWYIFNSRISTHRVKSKAPNELGIYDMSGNVWEWCADWYGDYPSSPTENPAGPASGLFRVFRGGGWFSFASLCRVSHRRSFAPTASNKFLGLRLAMDI